MNNWMSQSRIHKSIASAMQTFGSYKCYEAILPFGALMMHNFLAIKFFKITKNTNKNLAI